MSETKIIVATHKKYEMPAYQSYLPVHVGAEGKDLDLGYQKDNTGENISDKNASFCELTGLYWAWKNLDSQYTGLVHYRRYFSLRKKSKNAFDNILSDAEIEQLTNQYRVIVPEKRHYVIETLYSHYAHTHYAEQLDLTRQILEEKYPDYVQDYDKVVKQKFGYMFNMMIMEKELLNQYCSWIFDILFTLEERYDGSSLDKFQGRYFGRVSEIMFNVWLAHQVRMGQLNPKDIKEVKCIYMEKIDWVRKIRSFMQAKYFGKKYKGSF